MSGGSIVHGRTAFQRHSLSKKRREDPDQRWLPEIVQLTLVHGLKLYELSPRQKSLEELFVRIIGDDEDENINYH